MMPALRLVPVLVAAAALLAAVAPLTACATAPTPSAEARAHASLAQVPPDYAAAREAFEEAAAEGSPTAMSYLGWLYEEGHGVAPDLARAAHWYGRAAEAGAHDFAVKLGWMYLAGQGVEQDRAAAEHWFTSAIAAGHAPARVALASVLVSDALGGVAPERVYEARGLLEDALADGQRVAAFFLTRIHMEGIGGHPVDMAEAARYARLGADDGNAQMQGWLAYMYFAGEGVERDLVAAAQWANLAAAGGDRLGDELRRVVEATLSAEDIQRAREQAVAWALARR